MSGTHFVPTDLAEEREAGAPGGSFLVPCGRNVAHLLVNDAVALHEHLVAHGVRIIKGLRDADHGLLGFVFADPDGNRIDVGQRL